MSHREPTRPSPSSSLGGLSGPEGLRRLLEEAGQRAAFAADCARHFELLLKWNRTHNLTRITAPEEAARSHYLDCAAGTAVCVAALGAPEAVIDVGSGAGFPGVIAALWLRAEFGHAPRLTLVEPARKRASFLQLACRSLQLAVEVQDPWQAGQPPPGFELPLAGQAGVRLWVTCRATFSEGERGALRPYWQWARRQAPAALCAWTTHHESATWHQELSTWGFSSTTDHFYALHVRGAAHHAGGAEEGAAGELQRVVLIGR